MHSVRYGTTHASAAPLGAGSLDKSVVRSENMEMPEMLYKLCLVARELEVSYAACGAGVRIGSPCLVRLLHDAVFREGSSDAVHPAKKILSWSANRNSARLGQNQVQVPESGRSAAIRCQ